MSPEERRKAYYRRSAWVVAFGVCFFGGWWLYAGGWRVFV